MSNQANQIAMPAFQLERIFAECLVAAMRPIEAKITALEAAVQRMNPPEQAYSSKEAARMLGISECKLRKLSILRSIDFVQAGERSPRRYTLAHINKYRQEIERQAA